MVTTIKQKDFYDDLLCIFSEILENIQSELEKESTEIELEKISDKDENNERDFTEIW